jgi:hypothetical protein
MSHRVFVEEVETRKGVGYRWECSCRRSGAPVTTKRYAEELGAKHVTRFTPKPQGPKALRDLLKFED